uniref:S-layer homology domain-containing protein n=1 Tax=Dysosmobacter sp. TaxID=2591382 RepID=UPI003AF0BF15
TGALARTGEQLTMDVAQGNDGNGHSTAAITLRNNCLQSQTSAALVATLLDAAGTVLETKKTRIGGAISGETFRTETVTFSRLGTRVVVRAAVPGKDLLTFEGLAVGLGDFTANGTNYTYTLQNDSGATSTLVTAVSGNDEPVSINGQALSTGGSATVAIPKSGTTNIVVGIGAKTYTLTILRNSGTGGNEGGSGSGGGSGYSYYTIKATAGAGGSISPSGNVSVREGRDQTFTITPDKGYAVANVKIDGKSIGAVKSYTFENVRRTHTIEVIFMKANGTPQTGVFVDVATGSYYEDAVDWAVENGITKGTDDTHFSPDGICTRAQAVTFLWRAAGSPEPETRTMPFTDIPVGSYYYDAVLWAVENGITKGTSDTTFTPNMTCTRAQIVAFLWRSEKSPAAGTANPFADVKSTAYYADAVLWAVKENITKGTTNTTFSPDADCTRAQIVTFLYRFTVE